MKSRIIIMVCGVFITCILSVWPLSISDDTPAFINPQTAAVELRSAYYGSGGWQIGLPEHADNMFAVFGNYLLRYNVAGNTLDKAVKRTGPDGSESVWRLSADGKYALSHRMYHHSGRPAGDIYLLDFESGRVSHVSDNPDTFSMDQLPDHIRGAFDPVSWGWDAGARALEEFTLAYEPFEEFVYSLYVYDAGGQKREIPELRNAFFLDNEPPYAVIDGKTICTLIPMDADSNFALGYYKFVLIDVASASVLQECPINSGPVPRELFPWHTS